MAVPPPPPPAPRTAPLAATADPSADSAFEATAWDQLIARSTPAAAATGARRSAWAALAMLLVLAGVALAVRLAHEPALGAQWRGEAPQRLELVAAGGHGALRGLEGRTLLAFTGSDGQRVAVDAQLAQRAARWIVDGGVRARHIEQHERLARALAAGPVVLELEGARLVQVQAAPLGLGRLGAAFWVMGLLAIGLVLIGARLLLAQPSLRSALYALMTAAQAGNLLAIAVESLPGLALPLGFPAASLPLRGALDLVTAAAIVHATGLHPRPVRHRRVLAALAWAVTAALLLATASGRWPHAWWGVQAGLLGLGLAAVWQLGHAQADEPHPLAVLMRRFGVVTIGTLAALTLALAASAPAAGSTGAVASAAVVLWSVYLAAMLAAMPFVARPQPLLREFALLAGVGSFAAALNLLLGAWLSFGSFASLTLTMFAALGLYVTLRHWILAPLIGSTMLTTERMFEQLYRSARELQLRPERMPESVSHLLRELFAPLQVLQVAREAERARVIGNGSTMLVPLPRLAAEAHDGAAGATIVLRFAHRGKRLFTPEDARLSDRVLEQLRRAVDYDRAVEQGRSEERVRIAQDLHDDIGARLLTLMYQAPTPEVEDYVRHTLQDLKTLTRGLAAPPHRLSHAAAEWKTDITQRLAAAQCELAWSFSADRDIVLSVVQWSALTRVLRELVSNVIAHARASRLEIDAVYYGGRLVLTVSDNGLGRDPTSWAHGLGLGGVRKRVKQLGGRVAWRENTGNGVRCEVEVPNLDERR